MFLLRHLAAVLFFLTPVDTMLAKAAAEGARYAGDTTSAATTIALPSSSELKPPSSTFHGSFAAWRAACAKLPSNRAQQGRLPRKDLLPLLEFGELAEVLAAFFDQCKTGALARTDQWVGQTPATNGFFNTATGYFMKPETARSPPVLFQPFAQKLVLPTGSEAFFRADLHGDLRSLLADLTWLNEHGYLREFSVARPDFYMIFLGDYTDRGVYGVEVLYTLF